jgi:hypothetical protein
MSNITACITKHGFKDLRLSAVRVELRGIKKKNQRAQAERSTAHFLKNDCFFNKKAGALSITASNA